MSNGLICILEDDEDVLKLISRILIDQQYDVVAYRSGETLLSAIDQFEIYPDLFILDIMLPKMDGFQVAREILQKPGVSNIPIIFLTARGSSESLEFGLNLGAVDYIRKPFQPVELLARVRATLRIKFLHDQLRTSNRELQDLAMTDSLTGLRNRRFVVEQLRTNMSFARRYRQSLCCLMLDLDNFKEINDRFGHLVGDEILIQTSRLLRSLVRTSDILARYGGDEFVLVCPHTSESDGQILVNRLSVAFSRHIFSINAPEPISMTITIGMAVFNPMLDDSPEIFLDRVDKLMYANKK
ncbi:MAG TPA: diguanylate cyclase [Anaerolineales bacterium]|nr:diguanylate cyclase [Anaerolineales bacterium]